jgi:hypothetical protein
MRNISDFKRRTYCVECGDRLSHKDKNDRVIWEVKFNTDDGVICHSCFTDRLDRKFMSICKMISISCNEYKI